MVKKIIWAENALQDRLQILTYWHQRIGNKKYALFLDSQFREAVDIICRFPKVGRVHPLTNTRFLVKEYYLIFYQENEKENEIHILHIFDGRRNPEILESH